jgi:outer membrane protein OmpA-like peptidoglycan-associated protein
MKMYPNVKIAVQGHTDIRNTDQYNVVLSWNRSNQAIEYLMKAYGLPRERFLIKHDGEAINLVKNASSESAHYMNRRVEFHIANANDTDMPRPEGKAGKL